MNSVPELSTENSYCRSFGAAPWTLTGYTGVTLLRLVRLDIRSTNENQGWIQKVQETLYGEVGWSCSCGNCIAWYQ